MKTSGGRILLLAATLGLAACSSQESALVKPVDSVKAPAAPVDSVQTPAAAIAKRPQQNSLLRRKVVSLLEKKNYRQALELINGKNREGLEREYILAVNGLLDAGNEAFSSGDYATAARAFKGVITAYPVEPSLRSQISQSPKRIRAQQEACMKRLMEQGLEEYRRGKLESAIRKWKSLLAISPGHLEAKKALDTTMVQLRSMKDM